MLLQAKLSYVCDHVTHPLNSTDVQVPKSLRFPSKHPGGVS